jgi:hypothetical protein
VVVTLAGVAVPCLMKNPMSSIKMEATMEVKALCLLNSRILAVTSKEVLMLSHPAISKSSLSSPSI